MRARPEGQSGLPDRRTGETRFARGPSGRAASPGVKVPTRASVRVTSGAHRSDLHLCRSTRTVRDEDKALYTASWASTRSVVQEQRLQTLVGGVGVETEAAAFRIVRA